MTLLHEKWLGEALKHLLEQGIFKAQDKARLYYSQVIFSTLTFMEEYGVHDEQVHDGEFDPDPEEQNIPGFATYYFSTNQEALSMIASDISTWELMTEAIIDNIDRWVDLSLLEEPLEIDLLIRNHIYSACLNALSETYDLIYKR